MRLLFSLTGYLLYVLVVLVCLLWLLFPAETVKGWLEQQLETQYPQYGWKIGSVALTLPDGLVMTDVEMKSPEGENSLLRVDRFSLIPDAAHLVRKNKALKYSLELLKGTVQGRILLSFDSKLFTCTGTFGGLQLAQMHSLRESLGRELDGTVAGSFSGQGALRGLRQAKWQGNLRVTDGTLQFRESVLGVHKLPYTKIETDFSLQSGQWMFEQGKLQSSMMNGTFSGTVRINGNPAAGQLQFTGVLTPRSEMFAGLGNKQMVEVVRTHLKDGGLPFTVSGTVGNPGILFGGELSQALQSLKGSTK